MSGVVNMIKSLMRWAVVNSFSLDNKDFPIHQIEYMGKKADASAWYPYGYHANPGSETLSLLLAIGGNPENRIVMPGSPKERIDPLMPTPLAENEVILFHPPTKSYIHLKADGTIDIDSQKDVNIRVVGDMLADVEGDLTADVEGDITADAAGDANIIAGGDVDIDATANIELDGVNITITASGNLRTLSDSTQFQNAAGNDDLGLILRTLFNNLFTSSYHDSTYRNWFGDARGDIDNLR